MRFFKFVLPALFCCAVSLSAQTVDEIIAKNIQAHGGTANLKAVQSMRVTGSFEVSEFQASFTQVFKRPMKVRLDATVNGLTLTQAYDGQNGWQIVPFTGNNNPEPMAGDDLKRIREEADFDGPLLDYNKKGNTVEFVGKEKTDGTDTYHLKVTLKGGDVRNLYIDSNTFLTAKTLFKTTVQGTEVELETKFADFRDVQGVKIPFSIEQHAVDGQIPAQKISFQKVDVNTTVEDSLFKMPAPAPAADTAPAGGQPKPN